MKSTSAIALIFSLYFASRGSLFGDTLLEACCAQALPVSTNSSPVLYPKSSKARDNLNPGTTEFWNGSTSTPIHDPPAAHEAPDPDDGGPLPEEIAVYVCIGLAALLIGVCCYFCSKHCWCPATRRPRRTIVYRHMTIPIPANVNIFTRNADESAGFGLLRPDVSPAMRRVSPIRTEDIVLASLPTLEELESLYESQYASLHRTASNLELDLGRREQSPPPSYDESKKHSTPRV